MPENMTSQASPDPFLLLLPPKACKSKEEEINDKPPTTPTRARREYQPSVVISDIPGAVSPFLLASHADIVPDEVRFTCYLLVDISSAQHCTAFLSTYLTLTDLGSRTSKESSLLVLILHHDWPVISTHSQG
jgi:hypothetical protein